MKIISATQISNKHVADIYRLECVQQISKDSISANPIFEVYLPAGQSDEIYVILYRGMLAEGSPRVAYLSDWLCETDNGWLVLSDEEYQKQKEENG
mgnify:FL=1